MAEDKIDYMAILNTIIGSSSDDFIEAMDKAIIHALPLILKRVADKVTPEEDWDYTFDKEWITGMKDDIIKELGI